MHTRLRNTICGAALCAALLVTSAASASDRLVVSEGFTQWTCVYCPYAGWAQNHIQNNYPDDVIVLQWRVGDAWWTPLGNDRFNWDYYGSGVPTTWFDGVNRYVGGNPNQSQMNQLYVNALQARINVAPEATIEIQVEERPNQDQTYAVTVNATFNDDGETRPSEIFLVRVRDYYPGTEDRHRNCVREGVKVQVAGEPGETYTVTHSFTLDNNDWALREDCRFVAWAQKNDPSNPPSWSNPGGEIYQAGVESFPFEPPNPPGDISGDGIVDGGDLNLLLSVWSCLPADCGDADLNGDGTVDGGDLNILLSNWTE